MDRLTGRTPNGNAYLVNVKPSEQEVDSPYVNTLQCILECFERLAAYEDAEEQGLLVRLPCKVGDTIYRTYEGDIFDWTIDSIVVFQAETFLVDDSDYYISLDEIGKTVFRTPEEAEAAMKERAEQ